MEVKIKPKIIILIFLLGVGLICMLSSEAKLAKIYRSELETMQGNKWLHVYQLIRGWDFKVMDSWKAENPNEEWIKKRTNQNMRHMERLTARGNLWGRMISILQILSP